MFNILKKTLFLSFSFLSKKAFANSELELCSDGTVKDPSIGCIEAPGGIISSYSNMYDLIARVGDFMLVSAGSIATIMLIISGFQYATAMGDDEKITTAKRNMKWS